MEHGGMELGVVDGAVEGPVRVSLVPLDDHFVQAGRAGDVTSIAAAGLIAMAADRLREAGALLGSSFAVAEALPSPLAEAILGCAVVASGDPNDEFWGASLDQVLLSDGALLEEVAPGLSSEDRVALLTCPVIRREPVFVTCDPARLTDSVRAVLAISAKRIVLVARVYDRLASRSGGKTRSAGEIAASLFQKKHPRPRTTLTEAYWGSTPQMLQLVADFDEDFEALWSELEDELRGTPDAATGQDREAAWAAEWYVRRRAQFRTFRTGLGRLASDLAQQAQPAERTAETVASRVQTLAQLLGVVLPTMLRVGELAPVAERLQDAANCIDQLQGSPGPATPRALAALEAQLTSLKARSWSNHLLFERLVESEPWRRKNAGRFVALHDGNLVAVAGEVVNPDARHLRAPQVPGPVLQDLDRLVMGAGLRPVTCSYYRVPSSAHPVVPTDIRS